MKIVIQRVLESTVSIEGGCNRSINEGLVLFIGFCSEDTEEDILWGVKKVINMKILRDEKNNSTLNTLDKKTDILVISQFTLLASTKKGNKPSWHKAADQKLAKVLYNQFIDVLKKMYSSKNVKIGFFGKNMQVHLINNGPITIILDSKNKL